MYGAIIVLAVLITARDYEARPFKAAAVLAVTVAVLLGMETYADVIGREVTLRRPLTHAERLAAARELLTVTGAAELPLLFLVLAGFDVVTPRLGFQLATGATLAELFYYGYLARRLAGRPLRHAVLTGLLVAGIGVALAIGKGYVHF